MSAYDKSSKVYFKGKLILKFNIDKNFQKENYTLTIDLNNLDECTSDGTNAYHPRIYDKRKRTFNECTSKTI